MYILYLSDRFNKSIYCLAIRMENDRFQIVFPKKIRDKIKYINYYPMIDERKIINFINIRKLKSISEEEKKQLVQLCLK